MARAFGVILVLALAGCGIEGTPVPLTPAGAPPVQGGERSGYF